MKTAIFKCPKCKGEFQHVFKLEFTPHEPKPLTCPYCGNIENLEEIKHK
jgi:DNA-directed RNA polymerase subunit RPC12/RpoP